MYNKKNKILVILGPTASGKTGLAVKLAYKYNGEIISADSRQVYKGMDIGTGKDLCEYSFKVRKNNKIITIKIPYHLIDVVSPKTEYNLAKFYKQANKAIEDILDRGKLPIIAGGTGLYAQALVDGYNINSVKPDKKLREELEKKSLKQLLSQLKRLYLNKYNNLNNSEQGNKRRLIRYIEISKNSEQEVKKINNNYKFLLLGLKWPREMLYKRINKRLIDRFEKEGMTKEVEELHNKNKVSWKRLESFGLEYKYIALYLQGKIEYKKMVEDLAQASRKFAKRQMTWYRRWEKQGTKIHWIQKKPEAEKIIKSFLK